MSKKQGALIFSNAFNHAFKFINNAEYNNKIYKYQTPLSYVMLQILLKIKILTSGKKSEILKVPKTKNKY